MWADFKRYEKEQNNNKKATAGSPILLFEQQFDPLSNSKIYIYIYVLNSRMENGKEEE